MPGVHEACATARSDTMHFIWAHPAGDAGAMDMYTGVGVGQ